MRLWRVSLVVLAYFCVAFPVWADNQICVVTTVDGTVENGVGAEPGVVREFVQDLDVPAECQTQAGNAWVLAHELRVTRVNSSAPTVNAMVDVRTLGSSRDVAPLQVLIEARVVEVDTNVFPQMGIEWTVFDGLPRAASVLGLGPAVSLDGDQTANQFVTVDQSTGTPLRTCWTRENGSFWEQCTNGNPAIRGIGLSLRVTPMLADLPFLEPRSRIVTDIPDPAGNITLDFSGIVPATDLIDDLQVVDPVNPVPLCTWPGSLPFECYLSLEEREKLRRSELVILITPTIVPPEGEGVTVHEVQLISADHYVFSNGFEGGDGSFWSIMSP